MWIAIAITSYFINAGVYAADKFLLSKRIHSSITYAFYVGIWSVFNFTLLIFAPWAPSFKELAIDLSAGVLFLITLVFWYKALHQSETTRVAPIVGALIPIFSLILSSVFLGESLSKRHLLAFALLVAGGVLISVKRTKIYFWQAVKERIKNIFGDVFGLIHARYRPTRRLLINSLLAAMCFAAYYVLMKYIYLNQPFIGGFVWSRLGTFIGVLFILLIPTWSKMVVERQRGVKTPKNLSLFLSVRLLAALAFIMLNLAISLGNVAIVNSLQGTQYLFLLLLILFISAKFPKILKEDLGFGVLMQKVIGAMLVGMGLYVLL